MTKDVQAFVLGLALFIGLSLVYLGMTSHGHDQGPFPGWVADVTIFLAPILAGGVCGISGPRRPIPTLLVLGIAAAVCFTGLDIAFAAHGRPLDVGGISNIGWIAAVSVLLMPLLVLIGGMLGIRIRNRFAYSVSRSLDN
jgi:hypothetical protein